VVGGGAIQLTKMTKDQMKEVVQPIEEKVDRNSVEIKSVNQVSNYKFFMIIPNISIQLLILNVSSNLEIRKDGKSILSVF
jgi:hypothetical protein